MIAYRGRHFDLIHFVLLFFRTILGIGVERTKQESHQLFWLRLLLILYLQSCFNIDAFEIG